MWFGWIEAACLAILIGFWLRDLSKNNRAVATEQADRVIAATHEHTQDVLNQINDLGRQLVYIERRLNELDKGLEPLAEIRDDVDVIKSIVKRLDGQ